MNIFDFFAEQLDNIVDEMDNAIGGKDVEGCNASLGNGGLDLEVPGPAHRDLLAPSGLHLGVALRHVAGHQGGARHHVAEEDGGEGLLVRQQAVQGGLRDLGEGLVGRREHCEGSLASKGLHKACSLHSCQESGEVRGGDGELRDVLGRGCRAVAGWGCSRCGEASQGDQGGGGEHCEKVGSFFFLLLVAITVVLPSMVVLTRLLSASMISFTLSKSPFFKAQPRFLSDIADCDNLWVGMRNKFTG